MAEKAALEIVNPWAVRIVRRALREFEPDVALVCMFEFHLSPAAVLALGPVPTVVWTHYYKLVCPIGSKLLPDRSQCRVPAGLVCWRSGCQSLAAHARDRPRYAPIPRAPPACDPGPACGGTAPAG